MCPVIKPNGILGRIKQLCQKAGGSDSFPFLSTAEVTLYPVLGSLLQVGYRHTRKSSVQGHIDGSRDWSLCFRSEG